MINPWHRISLKIFRFWGILKDVADLSFNIWKMNFVAAMGLKSIYENDHSIYIFTGQYFYM